MSLYSLCCYVLILECFEKFKCLFQLTVFIRNNKIEYIYFIGGNKHKMSFFKELKKNNDCIVSKKLNELLTEFSINNCKQIL